MFFGEVRVKTELDTAGESNIDDRSKETDQTALEKDG